MNTPTNTKAFNRIQGDMARDFRNVVSDAEELVRTVGQEGESRYADVSNRVKASIETAKARLGELGETARAKTVDTAKATDDFVRGNPWQAAGIGAGVVAHLRPAGSAVDAIRPGHSGRAGRNRMATGATRRSLAEPADAS